MSFLQANGIFSWGVYYGYGLAFIFGIYVTEASRLRIIFKHNQTPRVRISSLVGSGDYAAYILNAKIISS